MTAIRVGIVDPDQTTRRREVITPVFVPTRLRPAKKRACSILWEQLIKRARRAGRAHPDRGVRRARHMVGLRTGQRAALDNEAGWCTLAAVTRVARGPMIVSRLPRSLLPPRHGRRRFMVP